MRIYGDVPGDYAMMTLSPKSIRHQGADPCCFTYLQRIANMALLSFVFRLPFRLRCMNFA